MKNILKPFFVLGIISVLAFIFSCAGDGSGGDEATTDSRSAIAMSERTNAPILWNYDAEADSMVRLQIPQDVSIGMVLNEMNQRYPNLQIDSIKVSADTVFIRIDDASYLSQMGSTGNYAFLAEVVFSLTEVPSIKYVNFDFPIMDHATPGIYDREYFDNKVVN